MIRTPAALAALTLLVSGCSQTASDGVSAYGSAPGLRVCSGFGCKFDERITLTGEEMEQLKNIMSPGRDGPQAERKAVSRAVAWREQIARRKLHHPVDVEYSYQRNRNYRGQMDCIDESENTLSFLKFLRANGLLQHHVPARTYSSRGFLFDGRHPHSTATMADPAGRSWAVDSWKKPGGQEPQVVAYEVWKRERTSQ